jgi:hypothetical protein
MRGGSVELIRWPRLHFWGNCIRPFYMHLSFGVSVVSFISLVQQEILPRYAPSAARWELWEFLPNWHLYTWVILLLVILLIAIAEGSYQLAKRIQSEQAKEGKVITLLDAFGALLPIQEPRHHISQRPTRFLGLSSSV